MKSIDEQRVPAILTVSELDADEIRTQVEKIVASPALDSSPRLVELLNHLIEETLAGRANTIKGLTIAYAIYSAGESFNPETNSVVRVEAMRLRRRLAEYYLSTGSNDPIVIDIPKGSYVPKFTLNPKTSARSKPLQEDRQSAKPSGKPWWVSNVWPVSIVLVSVLLLVAIWRYYPVPGSSSNESSAEVEPRVSIIPSEAQVLTQQAFELMMPPEDGSRLAASLDLFQRAIEIDSSFAGGYAGKSIALSFRIIFMKSKSPPDDVLLSAKMAENAIANNPEFNLGYAALALAQALNRETDQALGSIRRFLTIWPHDANANAIAAAALMISGNPLPAIDLLSESLELDPDNSRTPYLNLLGIANFVTGNYAAAADNIESNMVQGGPTGPHMEVFLAASYMRMGKNLRAQATLEKMQQTHPDYPVENWLSNFIKSEDEVLAILNQFQLLSTPQSH